jgi:hypothetical protein
MRERWAPRLRSAVDAGYWLARCEGFCVDSPDGRIGLVERVNFRAGPDRPDSISVRAGRLGRWLFVFPIDEITDVVPTREQVVLRASPRPSWCEPALGSSRPPAAAA